MKGSDWKKSYPSEKTLHQFYWEKEGEELCDCRVKYFLLRHQSLKAQMYFFFSVYTCWYSGMFVCLCTWELFCYTSLTFKLSCKFLYSSVDSNETFKMCVGCMHHVASLS